MKNSRVNPNRRVLSWSRVRRWCEPVARAVRRIFRARDGTEYPAEFATAGSARWVVWLRVQPHPAGDARELRVVLFATGEATMHLSPTPGWYETVSLPDAAGAEIFSVLHMQFPSGIEDLHDEDILDGTPCSVVVHRRLPEYAVVSGSCNLAARGSRAWHSPATVRLAMVMLEIERRVRGTAG